MLVRLSYKPTSHLYSAWLLIITISTGTLALPFTQEICEEDLRGLWVEATGHCFVLQAQSKTWGQSWRGCESLALGLAREVGVKATGQLARIADFRLWDDLIQPYIERRGGSQDDVWIGIRSHPGLSGRFEGQVYTGQFSWMLSPVTYGDLVSSSNLKSDLDLQNVQLAFYCPKCIGGRGRNFIPNLCVAMQGENLRQWESDYCYQTNFSLCEIF